ncbi:fibronectin type III-like domain-containing protein [Hirsutella rhossiliensis]|uniref:beta-glucosidase n=1 Tax=Hirsutella rhossiliensis TaxID=111463 RepID=A0A9P8SMC1_9HYPO|nr:fibronectin type III-like domain-containing protein [Hirsutella rhossiliensis]KAH0966006.1 fibronectin type III-like domain-containing protein [Hirsutella rhossiliensis]
MKPLSTIAASLLPAVVQAKAVGPADYEPESEATAQLAYSPPHYPSPWMDPSAPGWEEAYVQARDFVSQLTLVEKVNLTTGIGWMGGSCVGNTGSVPRMGLHGLCLQDGPLGLRFSDYNSAFPVGLTSGATWSRHLWAARGKAMGAEARGKGVDVLLGPVAGPLGRVPTGGRNAEGFGSDPYLQGQGLAHTSGGIQKAGVIACAKHYIANEQEHFRQTGESQGEGFNISEALSSNVDDKTLHELYAWPFVDAINNSYGCQNSRLLNAVLKGEMGFQGFVMSDWQAQHSGAASAVAGLDMTMPGDTLFNSGRSYWGGNLTLAVLNGTVPAWRLDDMAMRIMAAYFKVGKTVENQIETNFNSWTRDSYGYADQAAKDNWQLINQQVDVRANHAAHIRESAAKGTVVLKNTGALPLHKPKFVAAIGEDAGPNPKGPNGCPDRGCDDGTLAMIWGSGTSNFPYLVTPDTALQNQAIQDGSRYESVLTNYAWDQTRALVTQPNVTAIVFANAASGEGYINVGGNTGDRNNLTLWKNGDDLIKNVSAVNPNTIVVIHSVGPVLVTDWYRNPNITAIVWAGQPGQESGNSLVDILYGKTSPGRSPFTWGPTAESYGTEVLYKPNNGNDAPQQDFSEGVFIDYRHFDKMAPGKPGTKGAPIYEFGFGLSWSTFEYSDLRVKKHNVQEYRPTDGETEPAPVLGENSLNLNDYAAPPYIRYVYQWIYPWLNTTSSGEEASRDADYGQTAEQFLPPGATDGSPQAKLPSSGPSGGNQRLWDVMYTVYVSLGGDYEPVRVLRGFERLEGIAPGQSVKFRTELTRRDLSNWDVAAQDWVITEEPKSVWVGSSSRKLPLHADLC